MSTYFAILTEIGEAKQANAIALGTTLKLTTMAVGDGSGNLPIPSRTQKKLINEVRRAPLNQLKPDPANPSQVIAEQVLPETVGGWWIREIGIYDEAGDLCAVANCPPSYKPQMSEGSGRTQVVRVVLIVSSTSAIELKIDPSVVLATRGYVVDYASPIVHSHDARDVVSGVFSDARIPKLDIKKIYELPEALSKLAGIDSPAFTGQPTAPTLAQFDSGKGVVNAEFLKKSGVQYSAYNANPSKGAIPAEFAGSIVFIDTTIRATAQIPDAGVPIGSVFTLMVNNGSADAIISPPAGGQFIYGSSGSGTTPITIPQCGSVTVAKVAPGVYAVMSGGYQNDPQFGSYFGPTGGWQKLPSGDMTQWGVVSSNASGDFIITFPTAFIATPTNIFCSQAYTPNSGVLGYSNASPISPTQAQGRSYGNGYGTYYFVKGRWR